VLKKIFSFSVCSELLVIRVALNLYLGRTLLPVIMIKIFHVSPCECWDSDLNKAMTTSSVICLLSYGLVIRLSLQGPDSGLNLGVQES
jgi:hypothetical protein